MSMDFVSNIIWTIVNSSNHAVSNTEGEVMCPSQETRGRRSDVPPTRDQREGEVMYPTQGPGEGEVMCPQQGTRGKEK